MPEPVSTEVATPATGGSPTATPTPSTTPASTTPSTTPGDSSTSRTGATGTPGEFSYKEDRSKWLPPHRIEETRTRAERDANTRYAAQLKERDDKIAALAGIRPVDPNAQKADDIRKAMFELFPWAKRFADLKPEQLERVINAADSADQASHYVQQGWKKHGQQMLGSVVEEVSTIVGGDLSDRAQGRLKAAFTNFIEAEVATSERTGDITPVLQKYLDGDDTVVQNFAKEWAEDFAKPAHRAQVSQDVQRISRRVPNSSGRAQVTSIQRPTEFKTLDERIEYAANLAKERGMEFGR